MFKLWLLLLVCCYTTPQHITDVSDDWCLERGFDKSNLSCDTCALLDESPTLENLQNEKNKAGNGNGEHNIDISAECRACCQDYKVNPLLRPEESLRGKYKYAILTYGDNIENQYGEIKDFIDRDMNDVLSFKGENRFQAIKSEEGSGDMMDMNMLMGLMGGGGGGFGSGPPKLMFFENRKKGGKWTEEDEDEAGEVIVLRGWKREDVKDMLLTLLPNA